MSCIYIYGGGEIDVRTVEAWRKIRFSFSSPSTLIGKYVQNGVIFFSPFWFLLFCWVLYIYIYAHISSEDSSICFRCIIFSYFFCPGRAKNRKKRRRKRRNDDTFWVSLVACCYTDDLFLIIEIGCLCALTRTFFSSFPRWYIYVDFYFYAYNRKANGPSSSMNDILVTINISMDKFLFNLSILFSYLTFFW
jgi:hypothetical protein